MSPMMIDSKKLTPTGYELIQIEDKHPTIFTLECRDRPRRCPYCRAARLHSKGRYQRRVRHLNHWDRPSVWEVQTRRYVCTQCERSFVPKLPAIQPYRRFSEPFRRWIYEQHHAGIDASTLASQEELGQATVSRCYAQFTERAAKERLSLQCPQVLGLDEHTLHRHHRFATTLCDLKNHRVFDVVPGRSCGELEPYLRQLKGRKQVKLVCIDLSSPYRALIRRYFPRAKIVADRFHVVRLIYAHFIEMIRAIAPQISWHRGHLACLRRPPERLSPEQRVRRQQLIDQHPALEPLLQLRDQLCALLNLKTQTKRQCRSHVRSLLNLISRLQGSQLAALQTLAKTLTQWSGPIAAMWRFSKNNGITEGFHRKMKLIQRRAYGFRNFNNYRHRVIAHCG